MCITCVDCGTSITRNGTCGRNPKRCKQCRLAFRARSGRRGGDKAKHQHSCIGCGVLFTSGRAVQKYCSMKCCRRAGRIVIKCSNPLCSNMISRRKSKVKKWKPYCSTKCSESRYPPPHVCQNPRCGKSFRMKHVTKNQWQNKGKYCCPECYHDHRWGQSRPRKQSTRAQIKRASSSSIATSLRKRCKVFGVTFDPACTRVKVLERDGWKCQKCGVLCNKEYRRDSASGAFELRNAEHDHIIPLSVPGSPGNVFENSQCLCRQCNGTKGNKPEGQLRLCLEEEAWGRGVRVRSLHNSKSCEAIPAEERSASRSRSRKPMAL